MANFWRGFIAAWFLLGWMVHVYLSLTAPQGYAVFGETALFPFFRDVWFAVIMPNITLFAFLLAAFELVVGVLLVSKGKWVKYGLVASLLFVLFLIQLGLGTAAADGPSDFVMNRLPNVIFGLIIILLFRVDFKETLLDALRNKLRPGQALVAKK